MAEEQSGVDETSHIERVADSLVSSDTGSLLYDLRTLESGWAYESPPQKPQTAATGVWRCY